MERQSKLLNIEYFETRLRDFNEIKKKELTYKIHESDRALSKSVYIEFWKGDGNFSYKQVTVRISDHPLENCPHIQLLIKPYEFLNKKKKQQFVKTLEMAIKIANKKSLFRKLDKISDAN